MKHTNTASRPPELIPATPQPNRFPKSLLALTVCLLLLPRQAAALGQERYVTTESRAGCPIAAKGTVAPLYADTADFPGVQRAAADLRADLHRVTGLAPLLTPEANDLRKHAIIVGTVGHSALVDQLVAERKLEVSAIVGKWESFLVQVVPNPLPGVESAVVIAGSDKRGTVYGIYDLSEQIGVSPWYYWADVPVKHQDSLFVKPGRFGSGPPAVKYRGIFLNDEYPALGGWANEKFGGFNHRFYTNVFELILRLKGNFLWPAMWNNSFATDDPLTPKLADEYGVVISTSHHEPMMRAWKEWERAGNRKGSWDYAKNAENLRAFWAEGLRRTKDYEKVITLAMRGDGDEPMSETDSVALLERVVADQRQQIAEVINPNVAAVPQVWALYKEVQGYYERGMRVPDDVILLWCDDNWGNLRRLPTGAERARAGGAGVYYHFDYVGGPRNYKWLNTTPITKVWDQMNLAYHHQANQIWVVNVGDLKPMEFPIEFFLTFAWNPAAWPKERLEEYGRLWATREFGPQHAADIADIVAKYTKYNGRRKPELLEPGTFSVVNYGEADRIVSEWQAIVAKAERISAQLPAEARDAFFQLVLHPAKACAIVSELYVAAAKNQFYAKQGRASANEFAIRARELFRADQELTDYYNLKLAGGKWNHLMDQTHIGYTYWQQPPSNTMPAVVAVELPEPAKMAVAVEGSAFAWPGSPEEAALDFDVFNQPRRFVDVFNRGQGEFEFNATASAPWIRLDARRGRVKSEQRLRVSVDWRRAPKGTATNSITITSPAGAPVTIKLITFNPIEPRRHVATSFVEADGYVAIEAEHYTRKTDTVARWEKIADFGRTLSSMTIFPVTAPSAAPPANAPCLEYEMHLFSTGKVEVAAVIAPTLNYAPERGLRFAVSFDNQPPQVLTAVPKGFFVDNGNRDWEESVRNNCREIKSTHTIARPGRHVLKVWMVDPAVALQRLVVNTGGVKPSYLGPPESFHGTVKISNRN